MNMYKKQEVYDSTLKYYHGDTMPTDVWMKKYCLKDNDGNYLEKNPTMMYERIARELHRIENKYPNPLTYEEILYLLNEQIILPSGGILFGVGNNYSYSTLGNCYVIGNNADSYGGICHTDQEQIQLMKRRKYRSAS